MFRTLIQRLRGQPAATNPTRTDAAPTGAAAPATGALPAAAPATLPAVPSSASNAAQSVTAPVAIGARRPLIGGGGDIAGFEFRPAAGTLRRLIERGEPAARAAHTSALLAAMRLASAGGRIALGEWPAAWLLRPAVAAEVQAGMHLALAFDPALPLAADAPASLAALRAAGARVGWDAAVPPPASAPLTPDFLLLRPHGDTLDELLGALRAADGIPRIAIDIAGVDALEQVLRQGAAYAGCSLAGTERPPTRQPLPPQVTRICRLLNRLVAGAETGEIATEIKSDVGLGLRVLRLVNSAGMRRGREIESIDQALILLGRDELYRWLSVLLLSLADGRPASRALQQMALVRARLMELLAIDGREPLPGSLYTLGLASMLDVLLGLPRADAVDALALSDSARAALLDDAGPWSAYLRLARRIESGSAPDDDADAERFGGWPRVQALSADAWTWTATHAGGAAG